MSADDAVVGPFFVGSRNLPPWDRTGERYVDLSARIGTYAALGDAAAAKLLRTDPKYLPTFRRAGILLEGRIVERPFREDQPTHVCVASAEWTRLYLEPGETILDAILDLPSQWTLDEEAADVAGRPCIRIKRLVDVPAGDLAIVTDRRTYRLRLIDHPYKVTIACSWSYDDAVAGQRRWLSPAGERVRKDRSTAHNVRRTTYTVCQVGTSLRNHFDRWADVLDPKKSWQLVRYKALRRLAGIPTNAPHPPAVLRAVLDRLLASGMVNAQETRRWLEVPVEGDLVPTLIRMADVRRRTRNVLPNNAAPTAGDMLGAFPFLAGLPKTCFDVDDPYPAPAPRAYGLVWTMDAFAAAAALFSVIAPRFFSDLRVINEALRHLALLEGLARDSGLHASIQSSASLDALIERVLDSTMTPQEQVAATRSLLLFLRTIRRYMRLEKRKEIDGMRPAHPSQHVLARMSTAAAVAVRASRARRKSQVFSHAGRLADLEAAADLNLEQIALTTRALRTAAGTIGERSWIDVDVPTTIVDHKGRIQLGKQQVTWRLWNQAALLRKLAAGVEDKRAAAHMLAKAAVCDQGGQRPFVCEYRSIRGVLGSVPIEPFFVRYWRHGLLAPPGWLPPLTQRRRAASLKELKLPGMNGSARAGLLSGDEEQMAIWRTALRQNRTIVFLDPLEHALRFAHFGLSSTLENLSRRTAWIQQVQDRSGWQVRRRNKTDTLGFLAYDKGSHKTAAAPQMQWFPVGPKHFAEGLELARMTCDRCGYEDGILPEIPHFGSVRQKREIAEAWLFSYNGEVLDSDILERFLSYLLPGHDGITFHILRHLGANAAYDAGVPGWAIRLMLNHGSVGLWRYYAQRSPEQTHRFEEASRARRMERFADAQAEASAAA